MLVSILNALLVDLQIHIFNLPFSSQNQVPAAIMTVLEEKAVKVLNEMSRRGINLFYFLFWTSTYQLLCVGLLFWLDILPWHGNAPNIQAFGRKYVCLPFLFASYSKDL